MQITGSPELITSFLVLPLVLVALLATPLWQLRKSGALERGLFVRWLVGTLGWVGVWTVFGATRWLDIWDSRPPPALIAMLLLFSTTVVFAFSSIGDKLAALSYEKLIGAQAFRLPLELMMYEAYLEGLMPQQMSLAGYNYDILSGTLALGILVWSRLGEVPRWLVWGFNLLGTLLLLVILGIAVASLPLFLAFGVDNANTWVFGLPYIYLVCVMVPCALLGHLLIFRKLYRERSRRPQLATV